MPLRRLAWRNDAWKGHRDETPESDGIDPTGHMATHAQVPASAR